MGSYGLPALSIRPPEQPDLLGQIGKITQLKSLLQAQQIQQGQLAMQPEILKAEQLKNQQAQQAQQDNAIFTKAHQDAGGDWDKTIELARQNGASEQAIQTRQIAIADAQKKLSEKSKDDLANYQSQTQLVAQQAGAALQAPPEQRPQLVQQGLQQMVQAKILKPEDALAQWQQYQQQGDAFLKSHLAGAVTAQQQIENAQKQKEQDATLPGKVAKSQQEVAIAQGMGPGGITAEQQQTAAQRAQQLKYEGQKVFLEGQRLKLEKTAPGTWSVQEDPTGKPILFNNKSGEVKDAPAAIAKPGTYQKQMGGAEESVQYAKDYLNSKNFTGPGDEALMEKFFDVAKPSTGFRMTQPQMDMLNHAQSLQQGLIAKGKHLLSPNAPYFDDTQREHIVNTMNDIIAAKREVRGGGAAPAGSQQTRTYQGATYVQQSDGSWKRQ